MADPMNTIDLSEYKNIARDGAMFWAQARANREQKAMRVYVGPPGSGLDTQERIYNAWFVRSVDEPAPAKAEAVCDIQPKAKP